MSEWVKLTASDDVELEAYVARPAGEPKAALVLLQEIFGVNAHIQSVADRYAKQGYLVIAPQTFDRQEKGVNLHYDQEGWAEAMRLAKGIQMDKSVEDVDAAVQWLSTATHTKVGVVGFCFGGSLAWLAATRLKVDAAVGYYPGAIGNFAEEQPKAPVMLHVGGKDEHIPHEVIEKVKAAHPDLPLYVYSDAGHAFNRDADPSAYVPDAARLAEERTLAFLAQHLGPA